VLLAADDVSRSLNGVWDLLNRRARGLRHFDFDRNGLFKSFAAMLLASPAYLALLAAERLTRGEALPGTSLFANRPLALAAAFSCFSAWITLPLTGWLLSSVLRRRRTILAFVIAINWSNVLASLILAVPAALYALGLATQTLSQVYTFAFAIVIAQMRWFVSKMTLDLSAEFAAGLVAADFGLESLVHQALRLWV
jgi:hypothetical protein